MNSLCVVVAVWLNASQRSRVGLGLNKYKALDTALIKNRLDTALI